MPGYKMVPCKHCSTPVSVDYRAKWGVCELCRIE
jgi:hypothetical protein